MTKMTCCVLWSGETWARVEGVIERAIAVTNVAAIAILILRKRFVDAVASLAKLGIGKSVTSRGICATRVASIAAAV